MKINCNLKSLFYKLKVNYYVVGSTYRSNINLKIHLPCIFDYNCEIAMFFKFRVGIL